MLLFHLSLLHSHGKRQGWDSHDSSELTASCVCARTRVCAGAGGENCGGKSEEGSTPFQGHLRICWVALEKSMNLLASVSPSVQWAE